MLTSGEASPHAAKVIRSCKTALLGGICDDMAVADARHPDEARRRAGGAVDTLVVS